MKRSPSYVVAVFSAQECVICSPSDAITLLSCVPNEAPPDHESLLAIQAKIQAAVQSMTKQRLVILVPDTWLSVTEHQIDHLIPTKLRPLAALSYAAEATFTPPDSVMFHYQCAALPGKQTCLTVFACSVAWAESLCRPFQDHSSSYFMVPMSQWADDTVPISRRTWRYCRKKALFVYRPDEGARRQTRRLWWSVLVLSVMLNTAAALSLWNLKQTSAAMQADRQTAQSRQPAWLYSSQQDGFADSVLGLTHALPRSVRVLSLTGAEGRAELRILLSAASLEPLLANWRLQQPAWQWQLIEHERASLSPTQSLEVVNVSITILASE